MTINHNFACLRFYNGTGVKLLRDRPEFGSVDVTEKLDVTDLKTTVFKVFYLFQSDP